MLVKLHAQPCILFPVRSSGLKISMQWKTKSGPWWFGLSPIMWSWYISYCQIINFSIIEHFSPTLQITQRNVNPKIWEFCWPRDYLGAALAICSVSGNFLLNRMYSGYHITLTAELTLCASVGKIIILTFWISTSVKWGVGASSSLKKAFCNSIILFYSTFWNWSQNKRWEKLYCTVNIQNDSDITFL